MLNPKMISGKTYEQRMEENLNRIPIYSDEWTNFNPSDPGITILENLSAFETLQQNQMDEIPDVVREKLLQLLGYTPQKGCGASVYLEPRGAKEDFNIPADKRFLVGNISFETTLARRMTASHIRGVFGKSEQGVSDLSYVLDPHKTIQAAVFGTHPKNGMELYLVLDRPLQPGEQGILYAQVSRKYSRNPFEKDGDISFCEMEWDCYTEDGFVPMQVKDETHGFLEDGMLQFTQPVQQAALFPETEGIASGYVWRATLRDARYDVAPLLLYLTGFLFPVVQKETLVITHTFQKPSNVALECAMAEENYVHVFCKERKGSSYRMYKEAVSGTEQGRFFVRERLDHGVYAFRFDKERFGYAPEYVKNAVKVVLYNEEMMRRYELGEVYGYDNQEIRLPGEHIVTDTFSMIAERTCEDGSRIYDFVKPGRMQEQAFSYRLYENEGKVVIVDAGDYVGAKLYLGSLAVTLGEEGNVREGNLFVPKEGQGEIYYVNPIKGTGGRFQETIEDVRKRFIHEMNTPYTAVVNSDYEALAGAVPGLCISKVHAWMDEGKNEVQVAVLPDLPGKFPKLSEDYKERIEQWLDARRLLSTRVRVRQPVYQAVSVSGTIYIHPHYENCREQMENLLAAELDYIHGKQGFGEKLHFDRLFHVLEALEGVAYISDFCISVEGGKNAKAEGADILPNANCLLYPGKIKLQILPVVGERR